MINIPKELKNMIFGYIYNYPEATCVKDINPSLLSYLLKISVCTEILDEHDNWYFYVDGILHSIDDKPSQILFDGTQKWFRNGKLYRASLDENGLTLPAYIGANGIQKWFVNDKLHRIDKDKNGYILPAFVHINGEERWYWYGKIHRICKDDYGKVLPAIEGNNYKEWYTFGKRNRTCVDENNLVMPAIIFPDNRSWYKDGQYDDGKVLPAIIFSNGQDDIKSWYKNGILHRSCTDKNGNLLPAVLYSNGYKKFYLEGVKIYN